MAKNSTTWIVLLTAVLAVGSVPAFGAQFNEAPQLQEMVEAGELPPVEQRLPEEPVVVTPVHEVGQYGGTWYRYGTDSAWNDVRMKMYGHSPLRWVDDGLGIEGNWVQDWEHNEDATVWTLHLRRGVRWSDGEPLTTADFMFWWEDMVLNPEMSDPVPDVYTSAGQPAEISAPDDFTIVIEYAEPAPLVAERLAMWPNAGLGERQIAPKHYMQQYHPDYNPEAEDFEEFEERIEWWTHPGTPVLAEWMVEEHESGQRLALTRNPYFYAVDTEGNQLPYIDRMVTDFAEDQEVVLLQWMEGQVDYQLRPYADITDVSMLIDAQERGGYTLEFWDSGTGVANTWFPNWNHPDEAKRELYRMPEFRQAISHAINRETINTMVFYEMGVPTTGTFSAKAVEFNRTEEGQQLFEEWRTSYIEYNPDKAEELLDSIGVVDQNGDGWRQMPDGQELELRIDYDAGTATSDIQQNEMVEGFWEAIGLKTSLNPMDGARLGVMQQNAEFDIHNSWGVSDGPNVWVFPHWLVPIDQSRWAPLYGSWYAELQAGTAHDEPDTAPRDRTPPRKEPDPDGPIAQLQALYDQARVEADEEARDQLAFEVVRIHIEEGPFIPGAVGALPIPVLVADHMRNVPTGDDLALGGFVRPWIMAYPAITMPAQYWIAQ